MLGFAILLGVAWVVLPTSLGGQNAYVVTHGNSMEPRFHTGDLAVVRAADRYAVGDVVAYQSRTLQTTVLHRIVAVQEGRYVLKGDHNTFLDPEHPQPEQLIGKLLLRVPQGGTWLGRLTHPAVLALAALVLLTTGTQTSRHRDRRRPRGATMTQPRTIRLPALSAATAGRTGLAVAATLATLGLLLALVAWKAPRDLEAGKTPGPVPTTTFGYHAAVAPSAAYDGDTVTSPDPVFRRLANLVDVNVHYTGPPGTLAVTADVTAPSGWHTSLALAPATAFTGATQDATVRLDLNRIDARAKAAAQVIGLPYDQLTLAVVAQIRTRDGQLFTPTLNLVLTPAQLKLAGAPGTLTVAAPATQPQAGPDSATVRILGQSANPRTVSLVALGALLAAALLALLTTLLSGRRLRDEAHAIHTRHGNLLLPVKAPAVADHGETVDVQDFAALARTADRYGLVIMTWEDHGAQTFMVQDQGVRYRYTVTPGGRQSRSDRHQRNGSQPAAPPATGAYDAPANAS